jgi:sugar transferase (PEP-CTERM system associated)
MIRLFRVFIPTSLLGLFLSEVALTAICFLVGYALTGYDTYFYLFYEEGFEKTGLAVLTVILAAYYVDLYGDVRITSRIRLFQSFCLVFGIAFLLQALIGYLARPWMLSRWQMMLGSGLALMILPGWRIAYAQIAPKLPGRQRVLLLGQHPLLSVLSERMAEKPEFGMSVIGHLSEHELGVSDPRLGPRLGIPSDVRAVCEAEKPDLIIVGLEERRGRLPVYELLDLRLAGIRIEDMATAHEYVMSRISVETLRPSHLLFSHELGPNPFNVQLQRLYSLAIAIIGTILTLPLMLIVAVLVKLTSPGPALFRQRRVGLNGRIFELYKFRSMRADAEKATGAVWAVKNDPRITPIGKYLRKLRLDELPQFFNVLRGDMAICGPRPERPEFVKTLSEQIPFYSQRHSVLPGITGWAQINHKYGDTFEDTVTKLEYDLYYLKNLSPWLDAYIIFATAKVMLLSRGAQ